jgi:hypothetical protein
MHHVGLIVGLVLLSVAMLSGVGAVALLAAFTAAMAVLGVSLWLVDYYSAGSRADRAARDGRIGAALHHYSQCGIEQQLAPLLASALPDWPDARRALRGSFRDLVALETLVCRARGIGVSGGLLDSLDREVAVAASALRNLADRLGIAGISGGDSVEIQNSLERAVARIDDVTGALRAARFGLIELTLLDEVAADPILERASLRLRALGDAARELALLEQRR